MALSCSLFRAVITRAFFLPPFLSLFLLSHSPNTSYTAQYICFMPFTMLRSVIARAKRLAQPFLGGWACGPDTAALGRAGCKLAEGFFTGEESSCVTFTREGILPFGIRHCRFSDLLLVGPFAPLLWVCVLVFGVLVSFSLGLLSGVRRF